MYAQEARANDDTDDDDTDDNGVCAEQVPRPCGSWLRNRETVTDTKRRGILGMSRRIFLRDGELLAAMPLANQ